MGLFTPGGRAKYRRFEYTPRFYNPAHDDSLKRRMRVRSQTKRRSPARAVYFALVLVLILFLYLKLG